MGAPKADPSQAHFAGSGLLVGTTEKFGAKIEVVKTSTGSHVLKNVRVFKMGTFKDSRGIERTWEDAHLEQMIANFKLLRDAGALPNVPLRTYHSISVQNVAGYFVDVYRDAEDRTFLNADLEITEPDAFAKWERGTYRSRSLEVGMYETNDGAMYWPVIVGLAFVDLPAVEGLHARSGSTEAYFTQTLQDLDKELSMFTFNGQTFTDQAACEAAINYAAWVQAAEYAQQLEDTNKAIAYAAALEAHNANAQALGVQGLTVVTAQPAANHGATRSFAFRVNGQSTDDPLVAQRHIDTLESFRTETTKVNRERFVDDLAKANKIGAQQIDAFKAHVVELTDEGFASFAKLHEAAPTHPLLQQHGLEQNPAGGGDGTPTRQTLQEQFEIERDTVDQLKKSGMTDEQVKKTSAYGRFTALQAQLSGQTA